MPRGVCLFPLAMNVPTPPAEQAHLVDGAPLDNPPVLDTPFSASGTASFIDEPRSITPLPGPNVPFLSYRDSVASNADFMPGDAFKGNNLHMSDSQSPLDPSSAVAAPSSYEDLRKEAAELEPNVAKSTKGNKRGRILLAALAGLLVVIVAVVLGVYFGVIRNSKKSSSATSGSSSASGPKATGTKGGPTAGVIYGGDGTQVTTDQGNTFIYNNSFGGYFVSDPSNPFNNGARAQSWTPAMNETWQFGTDRISG